MATQQTVKQGSKRRQASLRIIYRLPLTVRRFAAAVVEVSLLAATTLVPYGIGVAAQSYSVGEPVPLNPVLANTQEAIAKTLALPLRDNNRQVPPLANLFWCGALFAPLAVTGWQLRKLAKTGQTSAKAMFGLRVVTVSGEAPGITRTLFREGVGRWGLPVGFAYMIWRYTGAFPDGGILLGLVGLLIVGENATLLFGKASRPLHDRLAGTFVLDAARKFAQSKNSQNGHRNGSSGRPIRMEVQSSWTEPDEETYTYRRRETFTTIVLTPSASWQYFNLWQWMRQNPGLALLIVAFAGMASVLGTFVGTQVYIQSQADRRVFKQQNNEVFLALVKQLSSTSPNALEERRGVLLALARLEDPRAVSFLVDLLGQEKREELIDAIGGALVSVGPPALPYLQRLNQSLENDQETLRRQGAPQEQQLIALRQQATQRAIAKIFTIYNGQVHKADLSRTDLGTVTKGPGQFALVLDKVDLSGINLKGAILSGASFRGSRFYGPGEDGRFGTFDDWIADLSGAELKEANLSDATLNQVVMNRTDLTRAILSRANLNGAKLSDVNLSSTQLIGADLREAILENASLTGAELTNANFSQTNLHGARLKQVSAIGTQFQFADLTQSSWEEADLTKANLRQANLQDADLNSTKLVGADLTQAKLQNANLRNADISSANLQGANVDGADFQGVAFATSAFTKSDQFIQSLPSAASSARVKGVNFANVKNLDEGQIAFICKQGGLHPKCP